MSKLGTTGSMPFLLALGLLLVACQPATMPQVTPTMQAEAVATASPMAQPSNTAVPPTPEPSATPAPTALPTDTAVPPMPEPATPTPTAIPATGPIPAADADPGDVYAVRLLQEVVVESLPQVVDITDRDAVLIFESSIPLACSVVYGKTMAYGQIAVDQDMGGGAHTAHQPLLLGLEADAEYHYRVQGTAADGTLYVGEDATFRTLPAEERVEVNLASLAAGARVIAVSSNFGGAANDGAWGANSALDGQRGTAWSSAGDGNAAFIEIELAGPAQLDFIEVWTRLMSDGTAQIFAFTLTTDRGEILGPFALQDAARSYRFEVDVMARSLRLDVVESSGGNTGLIEFAAYGTLIAD